jgi:hypothetical protein
MSERTSLELRAYLRQKKRDPIAEFDHVIDLVDVLFRLRTSAEDRFKKHRHLAHNKHKELPLEWTEIDHILNPPEETPPERLVTQIARNSMRDIESVVIDLRKVLARQREKVSLGLVQQVDSHCLQWLTRQPGRNAIEKAGSRQRILAVVRRENYNTLENRVLKDFLIRVGNLAQSYWSEYGLKFLMHPTIKSIKRLSNLCQEGLKLPIMDAIMGLQELPAPNYVLRQERRYSKIWKLYCQVVRQAQLVEYLWNRRTEVESIIKQLKAATPLHVSPCAKYYSQIWINHITGTTEFLDQPFWKNELGEKKESKQLAKSDTVIVDLTGKQPCRDLLIYSKHPNAKPYLQDYNHPSIEDIDVEHYYLCDILAQKYFGKLRDYFEQLYAILGGKRWVVLVPDHWDAEYQEQVIRSIPLHRSNVFLLWRSVATVLGAETCLKSASNNDCIAIIDFQQGGIVTVSKLWLVPEGNTTRLIPKRKSYLRHKEMCYREIHHKNQSALSHNDCFVNGKQENNVSYASFQNALKFVESITHVIVVGSDSQDIRQAVQSGLGKNVVIYYEDNANFPEKGADQFIKQKDSGIVSYYDELEELSLVMQTANESVVAKTLVKADEAFVGGEVYVGEEISDVWIKELQDKLLFYLCLGAAGPNTPLKLLEQQLNFAPDEKQELILKPHMTPGQGLAIVEVTSPFMRNPIVLDFLKNMRVTSDTISTIESNMQRSFPPDSPRVVADSDLWGVLKSKVNSYMSGRIPPDGEWFAKAVNVYSPWDILPFNASPLDRLKRRNVFGNEYNKRLPENGFDFNALFMKLSEDYRQCPINSTQWRSIIRLIAWTYQSTNPLFDKVKRDTLSRLEAYAEDGENALCPQEYTLCANLCVSSEDWLECFRAILKRIKNYNNRVTEYLRLLYNLLQFHPLILYETEYYKEYKCWLFMKHLLYWFERYKWDSKLVGYVLKCILYLLRCRRFDGKTFLDKVKDPDNYRIVRNALSATMIDPAKEDLRQLVLKYLDGAGTIEGLPTD